METSIVPGFAFEGQAVRVVVEGGEPMFCAADVCAVLDLGTEQTRRLEDDEKGLRLTQTPGGAQELLHITEAGLYRLVLGSRKPEAKRLQRWVTHEVLPAIRKTGGYGAPPAPLDLRDPAALRGLLTQLAEVNLEQQRLLAEAAPKVQFVDDLAESPGLLGLQATAKTLDEPPNLWIRWLRQQGHIYDRDGQTFARQDHIDAGRMVERVTVKDGKRYVQTKITSRGLVYFGERRPGIRSVRRAVRPAAPLLRLGVQR